MMISDREIMTERKGREATSTSQCCCFVLTTNHLPSWIEPEDRRYWIADITHDGHASGPRAEEFQAIVAALIRELGDPAFIQTLHRWFIGRKISDGFNPMSLNIVENSTDLMRRIHSSNESVTLKALEEHLNSLSVDALPEAQLRQYIAEEAKISENSLRHMMPELGWYSSKVKWDGKDYTRAIWVKSGSRVERGHLIDAKGVKTDLSELDEFKTLIPLDHDKRADLKTAPVDETY